MADVTEAPEEYQRPPVYARPLGGIVRVLERVFTLRMTQTEAHRES